MANERYIIKKYGRWYWGVIDNQTHLMVKGNVGPYDLLLFKEKEEAQKWCEEHNN